MSLDQQYSEISKSYASDPVAWQALSERAKAHARIFYEAKSWEIRLQYIFESLRDYKALPRPRIFLERGQTFVAFSDSRNSILGPPPPDPLVISPEVIQGASLGDYWVYGARGPLRNWTEIGRAINFLEEHPKISSLVFNCSTIKSDLSLAHEEKAFRLPRGSIAVIRLSHLLGVTSENPDSVLSETPRFREGSLHFAWTDVEKGKDLAVSLADVVTLGPQHYKSHPASHLSPRRLWNRLQYETCSFVKNF